MFDNDGQLQAWSDRKSGIDDATQAAARLAADNAELREQVRALATDNERLQQHARALDQRREALALTLASGQIGHWELDLQRQTSRRSLRHDQCFGYPEALAESAWGEQDFLAHVHADDRARMTVRFAAMVAGHSDLHEEFRVVWPDGSVHWLVARGCIGGHEGGAATRVLGIVMDITERKRAEDALRETKSLLEFTLTSAQVGDWDLDLLNDSSRRSLRHDQCFGYSTPIPDWGVRTFLAHIHPLDRARIDRTMRAAVDAQRDWGDEFRVVWPDGSVHWLAARGSIYRGGDGRAERMLGIVSDISDRKRAEEALCASEQMARGQVEALAQTLEAIALDQSPDRLAQHISRTITAQLGAHSNSVWRRNERDGLLAFEFAFEGGSFVTKTDPSLAGLSLLLPMEPDHPWTALLAAGKHCLVEDIRDAPVFALNDRLIAMGIVTVLMVPILISGRVDGVIAIRYMHKRDFRPEEIDFVKTLANQAVLAMQLTRLSAERRDSAVIEERNRMARDIHDTLAQGFTGVIVQLEAADDARLQGLGAEASGHLRRASQLARDSLAEARRSVLALRPRALEEADVGAALAAMFENAAAGTSVRAAFTVTGEAQPLAREWEENLLRVGQEAMTNALRHAQASRVDAELAFARDGIALTIRDNGRGFDPAGRHDGFGLVGMRERAELMGGRLAIDSAPGQGSVIAIVVPFGGAAARGAR